MGDFEMKITTISAHAQKLFNIGLLFAFGFDQDEARAFANASLAEDPSCAMCWWLLGYAWGPFLNHPAMVEDSFTAGKAASYAAKKLMDDGAVNVTRKEAARISALALRYQPSVAKQHRVSKPTNGLFPLHFVRMVIRILVFFGQRQQ